MLFNLQRAKSIRHCAFLHCPVLQCLLLWIHLSVSSRYVHKSLTSSLKRVSSLWGQVSSHYGQVASLSFRSSFKSRRKPSTSSPKSSLKSLPTLSCLPCLGRSFTNYVTQICVIWTHPTHVMYYGEWWCYGNITKLTQYYHLLFWKFRFLRLRVHTPGIHSWTIWPQRTHKTVKTKRKLPSKMYTPTNH